MLEQQILNQINNALGKAIIEELTGYNKPLSKLVENVISHHEDKLFDLIDKEMRSLINSKDFKQELKTALNAKIAKTLVSKLGGELESQVNKLKQNPATRAKITLALDQLIKDL